MMIRAKPDKRLRPLPLAKPNETEQVEQYLYLVRSVCSNVEVTLPAHVDRDDLYSNGLLGLIYALRNFKSDRKASLETYARIRIRGAILDGLRATDWIPRLIHKKARKVERIIIELEREHGRAPLPAEIAKALHITLATYERWEQEIRPPQFYYLDAPPLDLEGDSHYETQPEVTDHNQETPSEHAQRNESSAMLVARLNALPDKQRHVLWLFYFKGMRLWEIAGLCCVAECRVSQIHHEGLDSLARNPEVRRHRAAGLTSDLRPLTSFPA